MGRLTARVKIWLYGHFLPHLERNAPNVFSQLDKKIFWEKNVTQTTQQQKSHLYKPGFLLLSENRPPRERPFPVLGEKWYVKNHPPIKLVSGKESFDYELNVTCVYVCVCVLYICAKSFSIFMSVLSECCPWGDCGLIPVVLPPTTRESHLMRNLVQLLILISMVSTARRRKTHTQYKSNKQTHNSIVLHLSVVSQANRRWGADLGCQVHWRVFYGATCCSVFVHISPNTLFSRLGAQLYKPIYLLKAFWEIWFIIPFCAWYRDNWV